MTSNVTACPENHLHSTNNARGGPQTKASLRHWERKRPLHLVKSFVWYSLLVIWCFPLYPRMFSPPETVVKKEQNQQTRSKFFPVVSRWCRFFYICRWRWFFNITWWTVNSQIHNLLDSPFLHTQPAEQSIPRYMTCRGSNAQIQNLVDSQFIDTEPAGQSIPKYTTCWRVNS